MSNYLPDASARISGVLSTAQLSQRDVSLRVPINYVTTPGVSLSAACFSNARYMDGSAEQCFSNLLAVGFHRFVIDLYWDTSRLSWSLCPVELSSGGATEAVSQNGSSSSLSTPSQTTSASATLTFATLTQASNGKRDIAEDPATSDETATGSLQIQPRVTDGSSTSTNSGVSASSTPLGTPTSTGLSLTSSTVISKDEDVSGPTPLPNSGGIRYQIGPFTCDSTLGLSNITNVLSDYLKSTENSLNATLKYFVLNLHSAATYEDPTGVPPTPQGTLLPGIGNHISDLINASLSSYIYTPAALAAQRGSLNSTWFTVPYIYRPIEQYLDIQTYPNGDLYTADGWPSESFIELQRALRFLVGFGTIDTQMTGYNFTADADTIFPPRYISDQIDASFSSDSAVTTGCLFRSNATSISAVNSSWAVSDSLGVAAGDTSGIQLEAANLTTCGISPILNTTLINTADNITSSYIDYVHRTIWSWAYNEPQDTQASSDNAHCAAANYSNGGRWQVADCSDSHYGACRASEGPYNWTITGQSGQYDTMNDACQENEFSVPRTALENAYLYQAIQEWVQKADDDDDSSKLFWINFNDVDVTGCWVNGVNSTCPYVEQAKDKSSSVVVPVIAAVIVFVIAIIIILLKCAGNRRIARRRRRRGDGGWEYEGVPS